MSCDGRAKDPYLYSQDSFPFVTLKRTMKHASMTYRLTLARVCSSSGSRSPFFSFPFTS